MTPKHVDRLDIVLHYLADPAQQMPIGATIQRIDNQTGKEKVVDGKTFARHFLMEAAVLGNPILAPTQDYSAFRAQTDTRVNMVFDLSDVRVSSYGGVFATGFSCCGIGLDLLVIFGWGLGFERKV